MIIALMKFKTYLMIISSQSVMNYIWIFSEWQVKIFLHLFYPNLTL